MRKRILCAPLPTATKYILAKILFPKLSCHNIRNVMHN